MRNGAVRIVCCVIAGTMLAGCFGGGGGGGGTGPGYGSDINELARLGRQLDQLPRIDPADLPRTGSATYEGVAGFGLSVTRPTSRSLSGSVEMTVNFANGSVNGRIYDIYSAGNDYSREGAGPVGGQLTMRNGTIDRNPIDPRFHPAITADLVGTLREPAGYGTPPSTVVDGRLEAAFYGGDNQMVSGGISGRAGPPDGPTDVINGSFIAARR